MISLIYSNSLKSIVWCFPLSEYYGESLFQGSVHPYYTSFAAEIFGDQIIVSMNFDSWAVGGKMITKYLNVFSKIGELGNQVYPCCDEAINQCVDRSLSTYDSSQQGVDYLSNQTVVEQGVSLRQYINIIGTGGRDEFMYINTDRDIVFINFNSSEDKINLKALTSIQKFADLDIDLIDGNTEIRAGGSGRIILKDFTGNLADSDFVFAAPALSASNQCSPVTKTEKEWYDYLSYAANAAAVFAGVMTGIYVIKQKILIRSVALVQLRLYNRH